MDPRKDNTLPSRNDCFGRNLTVDIESNTNDSTPKSQDLDHDVVLQFRYCALKYVRAKGYLKETKSKDLDRDVILNVGIAH